MILVKNKYYYYDMLLSYEFWIAMCRKISVVWIFTVQCTSPPGKCCFIGPNELTFCVWPHMGCVWKIPWPKRCNHVSGSRLSPKSKNPEISEIFKFRFNWFIFYKTNHCCSSKTVDFRFFQGAVIFAKVR